MNVEHNKLFHQAVKELRFWPLPELLRQELLMALACDKCGTTDFRVEGRTFSLSFVCHDCRIIMCGVCAGRVTVDGITMLCCYNCRTTGIRDAGVWADQGTSRSDGSEPGATSHA